jgi:hypothetical protein
MGASVGGSDEGKEVAVGAASGLHATERTISMLTTVHRELYLSFMGPPWVNSGSDRNKKIQ